MSGKKDPHWEKYIQVRDALKNDRKAGKKNLLEAVGLPAHHYQRLATQDPNRVRLRNAVKRPKKAKKSAQPRVPAVILRSPHAAQVVPAILPQSSASSNAPVMFCVTDVATAERWMQQFFRR